MNNFIFQDRLPLLQLSRADLDLDAFDLYLKETGQTDLQIEPERPT
ncbi:MAG: hypothetical protein V3T83_14500 [Acidobacteriota bacterium]